MPAHGHVATERNQRQTVFRITALDPDQLLAEADRERVHAHAHFFGGEKMAELVKHQLATFYIRVIGDSMEPLIYSGELLIVDRMPEPMNRDIVVARLGDDLCVKRLRMFPDGSIYLMSENPNYRPIQITDEMDCEIWGKVLHSIKSFK